jgi:hypothetical protein
MSKIRLVDKEYNYTTFNVDCNYKYEFTLNGELETKQPTDGLSVDDLIFLLKEQFGEELEKILKPKQR